MNTNHELCDYIDDVTQHGRPNFVLAGVASTADALFAAVPDFGGYLLKIGSEKQGGVPSPSAINTIASQLIRNSSSGQQNGTALLTVLLTVLLLYRA
jgi:hypothetical protein